MCADRCMCFTQINACSAQFLALFACICIYLYLLGHVVVGDTRGGWRLLIEFRKIYSVFRNMLDMSPI